MSFGWHPREHRAALDGMLMLTLEERGAYNTLLDLIYDRGGPIPDDARWLAGWMGVSLKRWATIRASLIVKAKVHAVNVNGADCLMNERAAKEIENQAKLQRNAVLNGAKGGRKRAENEANSNENNGPSIPYLEGSLKLKTETQTKTKTEEPTTTNASPPEWQVMFKQAKEAAGDMADFTAPAMHHVADLRALVEPAAGEPCTWDEVLAAVAMTAMRQRAKRKPIRSWAWVKDDACALRDKRLNAANPAVAEVIPLRPGGGASFADRIAAENAEARRLAFAMLDQKNGKSN